MPTAWMKLIDLKPSTFRAHVKLRLIRAYDLISYRNAGDVYARECIFHDEEGNRVLATFPKEDFLLFNPTLKEGKLVRVSNPGVLTNNKPHLAGYKFKLSFGKKTIVAETYDDKFLDYVFNLKDFENTLMFDVIGALILDQPAYNKPMHGKDTLLMDVFLQDLEYRLKVQVVDDTGHLTLVLWDKHCLRILGKRAKELVKKTVISMT